MKSPLEIKKKQMELKRVLMARDEMELNVEERLADIERIKSNIQNQEARAKEIEAELIKMQGEA